MVETPVFYRDLAYIFVAALLGGLLARRLRQPLILGYIIGGIVVGPFTPGPSVQDFRTIELLAEVGVILLMYSIGLEFSFDELLRVRWVALVGTPVAMLLSIASGVLAGWLLGWPVQQGVAVGAIVSVASTMVLSRFLIDRGELRTTAGRIMLGMVLVEDLLVVILTIALPTLGGTASTRWVDVARALAKAGLILVPVSLLAAKLVPRLMRRVARTRSEELYLLVALVIGFATAAITQAAGLSLAAGAFLAGMIVSNSEYAHETLAHLLSLRDTFVALFFVTIGALIQPNALGHSIGVVVVLVLLVVVGKFIIRAGVVALFRYPLSTAFLVGIGLTQIGEFSFVLVRIARSSGLVNEGIYNATLAASLITILLNAGLMRVAPRWVRPRAAGVDLGAGDVGFELRDHVVICGFGRVGSLVGTALEAFAQPFIVIETDPDIIKALRIRGVRCIFGNASHLNILERTHIDRASLLVVTIPEQGSASAAVKNIRRLNAAVPIIGRAHRVSDRESLLNDGATQVIEPEIEASAVLVENALRYLPLPRNSAEEYVEALKAALHDARPVSSDGDFPVVKEVVVGDFENLGQTIAEARIRERFGVTIVTMSGSGRDVLVNPPANTTLRQGDRLRILGLPDQIEHFAAYIGARIADAGS